MASKKRCSEETPAECKRPCCASAARWDDGVQKMKVELGLECLTGRQNFNVQHWGVIIGGNRSYEVDIGRLFNANEIDVGFSFRGGETDSILLQRIIALPCEPMAVVGSKGVVAKHPDSLVLDEAKARSPEEYGPQGGSRPGGRKNLGFETAKTETQINEWIKEWVARNPRYHPFVHGGKNCQHFCVEFVNWLSDGECALQAQINSWPEDQQQQVEYVRTLRAAERVMFGNDMMADPDFVWNRRRRFELEEDYDEEDYDLEQWKMCWARCIAEFKRLKEESGDSAATELEEQFKKVSKIAKAFRPSRPVPHDCMMKLYGLYKQIENGDVEGSRPPIWRVEARSKWDARNQFKGMSKRECMDAYINEFDEQQARERPF